MPERETEKLHVPYKQFSPHRTEPGIEGIIRARVADPENVRPHELTKILEDLFSTQSEDHRNDWLELERWSDRLRDLYTISPEPPTWSSGDFSSTQPIPVTRNSSNIYELPGHGVGSWTTNSTIMPDPFRYGIFGSPVIALPGMYAATCHCQYNVQTPVIGFGGKSLFFAQLTFGMGNNPGDTIVRRPTLSYDYNGGGARNFVRETLFTTIVVKPGQLWSGNVTVSLYCPSSLTGQTVIASTRVIFVRIPVIYP